MSNQVQVELLMVSQLVPCQHRYSYMADDGVLALLRRC